MEDKLVKCAFDKWSMGWDYDGCAVIIKYDRWPIGGEIKLYDATYKDLKNLSEMFAELAERGFDRAEEKINEELDIL